MLLLACFLPRALFVLLTYSGRAAMGAIEPDLCERGSVARTWEGVEGGGYFCFVPPPFD